MPNGKSTAIAVLGGNLWYNEGVWQTNGLDAPGDHSGITLDRFRILAASHLAHLNPRADIIVSGGQVAAETPTIASVMARELEELDVSQDRIILEEKSRNTHQQLREIGLLMLEREARDVFLVSNEWHLSRVEAMIEHAPYLKEWQSISWQATPAEMVMLSANKPDWQTLVRKAREHPGLADRIRHEQKGLEDIKSGKYLYAPLPQ